MNAKKVKFAISKALGDWGASAFDGRQVFPDVILRLAANESLDAWLVDDRDVKFLVGHRFSYKLWVSAEKTVLIEGVVQPAALKLTCTVQPRRGSHTEDKYLRSSTVKDFSVPLRG